MVLVGAEGVVENGGVINKLGTCTLAITAHALGCPFYVAAESYKVSSAADVQMSSAWQPSPTRCAPQLS